MPVSCLTVISSAFQSLVAEDTEANILETFFLIIEFLFYWGCGFDQLFTYLSSSIFTIFKILQFSKPFFVQFVPKLHILVPLLLLQKVWGKWQLQFPCSSERWNNMKETSMRSDFLIFFYFVSVHCIRISSPATLLQLSKVSAFFECLTSCRRRFIALYILPPFK